MLGVIPLNFIKLNVHKPLYARFAFLIDFALRNSVM